MTEKEFEMKIDPKITEQSLIENCLMYANSGYNPIIMLTFYALAKSWKYDKLVYYLDLLGIGESNEKS